MATIFKRNGGWYVGFQWHGKRYRELAGKKITKLDAEQFMAKRMREVQRQGIYEKKLKPVTFAAFADDFLETDSPDKKSKDRDRSILEMLKVRWKGLNLTDISTKMIEVHKAERLKVRAPATVAMEIQIIKKLFKKAVDWRQLRESPAAIVRKPRFKNARVRFLEPEELARLFGHLPGWLRTIATFARFTGARLGEILGLLWTDVDFKHGTLTYRDTKSGDDVTVPMNRTVKALLESLPHPIDRTQRVFQLEDRRSTKSLIRRAWLTACSKAKITDFHFHDLRHQAATDLRHLGVDLGDVMEFLRHKSMAMTLRYAHIKDEKRRAAAEALDVLADPGEMVTVTVTGDVEDS